MSEFDIVDSALPLTLLAAALLIIGFICTATWLDTHRCDDGYVYVKTDTLKGCVTPGDAQQIKGEQ